MIVLAVQANQSPLGNILEQHKMILLCVSKLFYFSRFYKISILKISIVLALNYKKKVLKVMILFAQLIVANIFYFLFFSLGSG